MNVTVLLTHLPTYQPYLHTCQRNTGRIPRFHAREAHGSLSFLPTHLPTYLPTYLRYIPVRAKLLVSPAFMLGKLTDDDGGERERMVMAGMLPTAAAELSS